MARRKLSEATRWQIIGMRNAGMSLRQIDVNLGAILSSFQDTWLPMMLKIVQDLADPVRQQ